jgi:hypothetical protein
MGFKNFAYFLIQDYIIGLETKTQRVYCTVRNEILNIFVADSCL